MQRILHLFKYILVNESLIFSLHYSAHKDELHILFFPPVLTFNISQRKKYLFKVIYNNKHAIIEKKSSKAIISCTTK